MLFPHSAQPDSSGETFPGFLLVNSRRRLGMGVASAADLTGDRVWDLEFQLPPALPTGTAKLVLVAVANATSGAAKVNPKWASVSPEADPFNIALAAEGTKTITWSTGDAYAEKELKVALAAGSVVAGALLKMALTFEDSGFTLAVSSVWRAFIIWE